VSNQITVLYLCMLDIIFYSEDGDIMFLRNIGKLLQDYTASCIRSRVIVSVLASDKDGLLGGNLETCFIASTYFRYSIHMRFLVCGTIRQELFLYQNSTLLGTFSRDRSKKRSGKLLPLRPRSAVEFTPT
jgi:hypothetical protein